jgi:hypothetical protein
MGWEKLKSGGLWTPAGTVLLSKSADDEDGGAPRKHADWVLRTSVPEDSDGILSLTIRWTRDSRAVADVRGAASLPPGWGRLNQPALPEPAEKQDAGNPDVVPKADLATRIEEMKNANKHSVDSSSFRFRAEDNRVWRLSWERKKVETGFVCEPFRTFEQASGGLWFTCAASALLARRQSSGGLWAFDIPADVRAFVGKESIPCGVMVILGFVSEDDTPQWSSESEKAYRDEASIRAQRVHQQFMARIAAERLEATMSPQQASVHRMNRQAAERTEQMNDMRTSMAARDERAERRLQEAITSPRMNTKTVAEACLAWLIEQGEVGREWTLDQLVEAVLYLMVVDQSESQLGEARKIGLVLDEWMSWATAGGMKKQQVNFLTENKAAFCFAVSLVAVVSERVNSGSADQGRAGVDMLECLRLWRKVRLG